MLDIAAKMPADHIILLMKTSANPLKSRAKTNITGFNTNETVVVTLDNSIYTPQILKRDVSLIRLYIMALNLIIIPM